jgi:MOSC domain-containing protein YiiM
MSPPPDVEREEEELMATGAARVLSVNVGAVREFEYNGRPAKSGIWKPPVAGRIAARGINLDGDDQADRKAHGGPDKVLYAYAVENARWWEQEIGRTARIG